jgi:hypothetical protein
MKKNRFCNSEARRREHRGVRHTERHDRLPDELRLEEPQVPHWAHHRNRNQRMLPRGK